MSALQARCETLPPNKSLTNLEEAKRVFQELHILTQEAQALWQPSLFPSRVPQETPEKPPAAPAPEAWNELLTAVNSRVQTQAEDLSERTWQLALEQMGVLRVLLCLGLALYKHREGRARSPGAYLYGLMRRHQAGELKLEPWLRQIRHLTPPPMGAEGEVDYTLENCALYQLQRQRTEALLASYEERRRQRALERQQQVGQNGAS